MWCHIAILIGNILERKNDEIVTVASIAYHGYILIVDVTINYQYNDTLGVKEKSRNIQTLCATRDKLISAFSMRKYIERYHYKQYFDISEWIKLLYILCFIWNASMHWLIKTHSKQYTRCIVVIFTLIYRNSAYNDTFQYKGILSISLDTKPFLYQCIIF